MKIAVTVESTADLTKEILNEYDIKAIPFTVLMGEDEFEDGEGIAEKIFEFVNRTKTLAKTSALNDERYREFFDEVLKEYDAIIHLSIGSTLSSSCGNAQRVAQDYTNVKVIDSLSLSTGIGLLAIYARKLAKEGLPFDEIVDRVEKRVPKLQVSFVLKRLDYMYKGGRCSALTLFGANLLKIKPQIIVKGGKLVPNKKFRGTFDKCVMDYVNETLSEFNTPDLDTVFITYSSTTGDTVEKIKEKLIQKGFKKIYVTQAQGTVTAHCGEECLGILYINDGEFRA